MRCRTVLSVALLVTIGWGAGYGGAQEAASPAAPTGTSGAAAVFDAYCSLCHVSETLSRSWFGDAVGEEADRREAELVARLGSHTGCPHRNHEEIAAWLRQLSEKP